MYEAFTALVLLVLILVLMVVLMVLAAYLTLDLFKTFVALRAMVAKAREDHGPMRPNDGKRWRDE